METKAQIEDVLTVEECPEQKGRIYSPLRNPRNFHCDKECCHPTTLFSPVTIPYDNEDQMETETPRNPPDQKVDSSYPIGPQTPTQIPSPSAIATPPTCFSWYPSFTLSYHDENLRYSMGSRFCFTCTKTHSAQMIDLVTFEMDGERRREGLWKDCCYCGDGVCNSCVDLGSPDQCCFSSAFVCKKCRLKVPKFRSQPSISWFTSPVGFEYHSGRCHDCLNNKLLS